jgi:hypothetical protein
MVKFTNKIVVLLYWLLIEALSSNFIINQFFQTIIFYFIMYYNFIKSTIVLIVFTFTHQTQNFICGIVTINKIKINLHIWSNDYLKIFSYRMGSILLGV